MAQQSRCVYCGSGNFGSGCRYSPNSIHVHPDDPKKCSYCGSMNYGKGCRYGPNGMHVHGIQFNGMFKEHIESALMNNILLQLLTKPYEEFDAYKLGVINNEGSCIKRPDSIEEHKAYSPETQTILSIKKMLGTKVDILTSRLQLENTISTRNIPQEQLFYYEEQLTGIFNDLAQVMDQAIRDNIPLNTIFNFIKS